ncbi:MAG: hydrogenase subunit MbhD domain-containing protein, partial [Desulfurococcaceae archaeon]
MLAELIIYLIMAVLGIMSTIAVYLAIKERDLVKAVVYSALQSSFYAVLYYFLMAPDIVLVYLPVA